MNYSTAIFLINDKVRCVAGVYEADKQPDGSPVTPAPPRTLFKTLDQSITVGDLVLVPTETRHKFTVNKIVEVDIEPDIESSKPMAWIIGPVDDVIAAGRRVIAEEAKAIQLMKDAEKQHRRDELKAKVMAHVDQAKLGALQIAKRTDIDDDASGPGPGESL